MRVLSRVKNKRSMQIVNNIIALFFNEAALLNWLIRLDFKACRLSSILPCRTGLSDVTPGSGRRPEVWAIWYLNKAEQTRVLRR